MSYYLITSFSKEELADQVEQQRLAGHHLQGGVSVAACGAGFLYAQAMLGSPLDFKPFTCVQGQMTEELEGVIDEPQENDHNKPSDSFPKSQAQNYGLTPVWPANQFVVRGHIGAIEQDFMSGPAKLQLQTANNQILSLRTQEYALADLRRFSPYDPVWAVIQRTENDGLWLMSLDHINPPIPPEYTLRTTILSVFDENGVLKANLVESENPLIAHFDVDPAPEVLDRYIMAQTPLDIVLRTKHGRDEGIEYYITGFKVAE